MLALLPMVKKSPQCYLPLCEHSSQLAAYALLLFCCILNIHKNIQIMSRLFSKVHLIRVSIPKLVNKSY